MIKCMILLDNFENKKIAVKMSPFLKFALSFVK